MFCMVPGWMGIERVLNQVGPVVGRQMLMLGKRLTAQEAQVADVYKRQGSGDHHPQRRDDHPNF